MPPLATIVFLYAFAFQVWNWHGAFPSYGQPDPATTPFRLLPSLVFLFQSLTVISLAATLALVAIGFTQRRLGMCLIPVAVHAAFVLYFVVDPHGLLEWFAD